jgi:hypothetical protein
VSGEPFVWGATPAECAAAYPCDALLPNPQHRFFRAIDVDAPPALTFRWLQQLRVAPYSYDWADNFLIPSPARLTPRAATVAPGDRMMHIFRIHALEPGRSITLVPASRIGESLFGTLAGTYTVSARDNGARLFVKVLARYPRSIYGRVMDPVMPWIDLAMMRRQLQRLKAFAEADAQALRSIGSTARA